MCICVFARVEYIRFSSHDIEQFIQFDNNGVGKYCQHIHFSDELIQEV